MAVAQVKRKKAAGAGTKVAVSVRLPEWMVQALWRMAKEGRRPFTTQLEIALEAGLDVLGYDATA